MVFFFARARCGVRVGSSASARTPVVSSGLAGCGTATVRRLHTPLLHCSGARDVAGQRPGGRVPGGRRSGGCAARRHASASCGKQGGTARAASYGAAAAAAHATHARNISGIRRTAKHRAALASPCTRVSQAPGLLPARARSPRGRAATRREERAPRTRVRRRRDTRAASSDRKASKITRRRARQRRAACEPWPRGRSGRAAPAATRCAAARGRVPSPRTKKGRPGPFEGARANQLLGGVAR